MEIETKTSFPTPRNRQEWRRRRFAQNSGICVERWRAQGAHTALGRRDG